MFRVFRDSSAATSRRPVERVLCVRGDREQLFRRGVGSWRKKSRGAGGARSGAAPRGRRNLRVEKEGAL
jgi:hypothetical protein